MSMWHLITENLSTGQLTLVTKGESHRCVTEGMREKLNDHN
jgi:hypothetical protein